MSDSRSIYLNHAGTSWPKPAVVWEAVTAASAQDPAQWPDLFHAAHHTIAEFFRINASRLLLTPSCTAAIQLGVMDHPWAKGDRVISSSFEHHALQRTLVKLAEQAVDVRLIPFDGQGVCDLDALEKELRSAPVRLVALTAACNVTGELLPLAPIIELAHAHGALVLIDGAQIAGWLDIDVTRLKADLFTFAGHKGPQAPWGIGGLYVAEHVMMNCPLASCERPEDVPTVCAPMPGYCDAGSVNLFASAGMAAACRWLSEDPQRDRLRAARRLAAEFASSMRAIPNVVLHGDVPVENKVPTVALSVQHGSLANLAHNLRERNLIVSSGYQCAPQAHQALGTQAEGVVRVSFGPQSRTADMIEAVERFRGAIDQLA